MKKNNIVKTISLLALFFLSNCAESPSNAKIERKAVDTLLKSHSNASTKTESAEKKNIKKTEVECSSEAIKKKEGEPEQIKTCFYKNYKAVSKGYADYKGRYSYEYFLFKKQSNGQYKKIKNAEMFLDSQKLLVIINSRIKKDYQTYSNDEQTKDCFEGHSFTEYNFNQLGISFEENSINFEVSFGLSSACMSVDGTTISLSLEEIKNYIKE
ncbi:MAG: hypothetical protein SFU27_10835 [Thermonemataceae bacterium]|nr:hypothetical protein [Thermonemataceae bacterium]